MKTLFLLLLTVSTAFQAYAGTLTQARQKVDDWLALKWPDIVARQQNYFVNRGQYWQGLKTHTVVPAFTSGQDGDSIADRLDAQPDDVFSNWSTAFPDWVNAPIPCAVKCDVYQDPLDGWGWVATVYVRYNGTLYSRSRNVGPQAWRTRAWAVEIENPIP